MSLIGRQSIKSTIYLYLGVVVGFLLRAQLFPNFLSEAEIGILTLIVTYSSIFGQIALLGFNHGTIKYFPFFRNKTLGHHGFLGLYFLVALGGFLIFLAVYTLVGNFMFEPGDLFLEYYYLCIPLTAALLLFLVLDNYNTALYNATTGLLLREVVLRLLMLGFFLFIILGIINFQTYASLYVGTYSIIALLLLGFIVWRGDFNIKLSSQLWDREKLKGMASISFFGLLTGLNTVLIQQVNNIMVDQYYDEAMTGIYATNFLFATLVLLPSRGLNKIAPTIISDAFKNRQFDAINRLQYKSTINQMAIAILILLGIYINLHNVYRILPESYSIGQWVIILTGVANLVQMAGGVSSAIIGFSDYYRYNTYLSVLQLLLLVAINIWLLPLWGITGAALATLWAILGLNLIKFLVLKRKFNIQPYGKKHFLIIIIALLCLALNLLIPEIDQLIPDILIRSTLVSVVFIALCFFLKISREINQMLIKTLEKLRIR